MTYAFMKYWVEGTKEATHKLCEAIEKAEGWAENALNNLGIDTEEYETGRVEWNDAKVEDKDGYSVLYFEKENPYERGTLIDQLMDEEMFKGKLTNLYYYAEELANAELCETNDEDGKYFPYKILVHVVDEYGDMADEFFCKNEQELITTIREKYQLSEEYNSREALEKYFDNSNEYDCLSIHDIQVKCSNSSEFQFRIISSKWKETATFFEGLAAVEDDNEKWGFIDESFKEVIPCQWEGVWDFSEGLAAVQDADCMWGFINKQGEVAIPCQYIDIEPFRRGFAKVQDTDGNWIKIDKTGKVVEKV